MGMKFLNKKGWHTGSLRNIENVWKAEQKHDAEQKKLEELKKQIHEERERSEFRLLQEQAGLVPKQERLEFLYDSGLAVGKTSSDGFKTLEALPKADDPAASSSVKPSPGPGALFEDKPQSANDAWRKLHSDPLLMIRQREQEALARVRNNPVQMAMIRKSVEATKHVEDAGARKDKKRHHREKDSKHERHSLRSKHTSDAEKINFKDDEKRKSVDHRSAKYDKHSSEGKRDSDDEYGRRKSHRSKYKEDPTSDMLDRGTRDSGTRNRTDRSYKKPKDDGHLYESWTDADYVRKDKGKISSSQPGSIDYLATTLEHKSHHRRKFTAPKLSEEDRAAKLREMQMDAELHEEQRWKRLKRADEDDAQEANRAGVLGSKNFLDAAHKRVYGAEKGGSSTIEESVRRRTHYLQGRSEADSGNAFRR